MKVVSAVKKHSDIGVQFYDVINASPNNNFLIKTKKGTIVSHNCFFDEIN